MKSLFFTLAFILLSTLGFSQSKPYFIIEKSTQGYNISLKIENADNIKTVKINGEVVQNNKLHKVALKFNSKQIANNETIQNLNFDNAKAKFNIEIEDKNGNTTVYPSILLNIYEEMFASN